MATITWTAFDFTTYIFLEKHKGLNHLGFYLISEALGQNWIKCVPVLDLECLLFDRLYSLLFEYIYPINKWVPCYYMMHKSGMIAPVYSLAYFFVSAYMYVLLMGSVWWNDALNTVFPQHYVSNFIPNLILIIIIILTWYYLIYFLQIYQVQILYSYHNSMMSLYGICVTQVPLMCLMHHHLPLMGSGRCLVLG